MRKSESRERKDIVVETGISANPFSVHCAGSQEAQLHPRIMFNTKMVMTMTTVIPLVLTAVDNGVSYSFPP